MASCSVGIDAATSPSAFLINELESITTLAPCSWAGMHSTISPSLYAADIWSVSMTEYSVPIASMPRIACLPVWDGGGFASMRIVIGSMELPSAPPSSCMIMRVESFPCISMDCCCC